MVKAAAVRPARDAGYWRDQIEGLQGKLAAAAERADSLAADRAAVALEAHTGDAVAEKRLDRLGADLVSANQERGELEAALTGATDRLAEAEVDEALASRTERQARRETLMTARAKNARAAEKLIDSLGETLADMRAQAEEIVGLTAGRDLAESLKPIKTDQRLRLAMARAGFTWRDRQGVAHPLFPDAAGFAEAEIAAQGAYADKDVR